MCEAVHSHAPKVPTTIITTTTIIITIIIIITTIIIPITIKSSSSRNLALPYRPGVREAEGWRHATPSPHAQFTPLYF